MPEPNSGCWLWLGSTNGAGYGTLSGSRDKRLYAHRESYRLARGDIPAGLQLDHLCRNRLCVNPDHLEPVTNAENTRRGKVSALRPARLACKNGHPLSSNAYKDSRGATQCRACLHRRQAAYYRRKRDDV